MPSSRVLVLEDNSAILDAIVEALLRRKYDAAGAATFEAFRALVDAGAADLALIDRHIAGADSVALIQELRRRFPELPVVVMSSEATPEAVAACLRMGVKGYLAKPFELSALVQTVESLLRGR
ncbi:MAG: response regulator [Candidatus Riflebacteria bacterium]|nr:response regulator [Candidatus Riflebacteria bacterium]